MLHKKHWLHHLEGEAYDIAKCSKCGQKHWYDGSMGKQLPPGPPASWKDEFNERNAQETK